MARSAKGRTRSSPRVSWQRRRGRAQDHDVAKPEPDGREPLKNGLPATAQRHEADTVSRLQRDLNGRAPDQRRVLRDDALDDRDVALLALAARGEVEPRLRDQLVQALRLAPQQQHVIGVEARRRGWCVAAEPLAHDPGDRNVALLQGFEFRDRLTDHRRMRSENGLGRVAFDRECGIHRGRCLPLRQQAPAHGQERQGGDRDAESDGGEVEHGEGFAEHVGPDLGDDDVGRGADERHEAAGERGRRHRHQQRGRRCLVAPRKLKRDRHEDGQCPDVLGHH